MTGATHVADGGGLDAARTVQPQDDAACLRSVVDSLAIRVALIGPDGRVVCANAAWHQARPTLAAAQVGVGDDVRERLAATGGSEDAEGLARAVADVLAGASAEHTRVVPSAVSGGARWDLVTLRAVTRADGRYAVLGVEEITERLQATQALRHSEDELRRYREHLEELVGARTAALEEANRQLTREVGDRRRAEQALAESQQVFRALTDQSSVAILINRAEQLIYANAGATALSGYTLDELRRRPLWDLVPEPYRTVVRERSEARRRGEDVPTRFEVPILRRDGQERWIEVSVSPVDVWGERASLATAFDVTDRKRAEIERAQLASQMVHAQKLESLGMLAGGIAHDFNNLLVSMLGNASLALEALPPDSGALYSITQIERAALRASELTNQLLAYAGKGTLRREAVDCSALVTEMAQLLETAVARRGRLRLGCDPSVPAIEADPTQLRQVVMNLITNAAEALPDGGGTITLRTGRVEATPAMLAAAAVSGPAAPGPHVFIEVADSGRGIDAVARARIFDPFFTTKEAGHGLGLAAVVGIVRHHGGALLLTSTPGIGSSFRVLLPARAPAGGDAAAVAAAAAGGWRGRGTVLVVDDEAEVREVAETMLRRRGLDVVTAADGAEAVEALREPGARVVCVLLDLEMPGRSGEAAFAAIREVAPRVPVIISTGDSQHASLERLTSDSRTSVLGKPYGASQLAAAVRAAIALG